MQNSMGELFGIMNVLNPDEYGDEEEFLERFGKDMPTPEQVQALQVRSAREHPAVHCTTGSFR